MKRNGMNRSDVDDTFGLTPAQSNRVSPKRVAQPSDVRVRARFAETSYGIHQVEVMLRFAIRTTQPYHNQDQSTLSTLSQLSRQSQKRTAQDHGQSFQVSVRASDLAGRTTTITKEVSVNIPRFR